MKIIIIGFALIIAAVGGYFVSPSMGADSISLAVGMLLGGVLVSVLALVLPAKSAAGRSDSSSRPVRQAAGNSKPVSNGSNKTIYVGNLAFKASRHALSKLFSEYGEVISARVATDRNTRKPKGYGFVEMPASDADKAIKALEGHTFFGRNLKVAEARDN